MIGVTDRAVQVWEAGKYAPSNAVRFRIERVFGHLETSSLEPD